MNETIFLGECPIIRPEGIYYGGRRVIRLGLEGFGLGDVERANPLPIGKYWVDVFDKDAPSFQGWLDSNKNAIHVDATQTFPAVTHWFEPDEPGRTWYLFSVKNPVQWEGPGLPTIATKEVQVSGDTVQRPAAPEDPLDQIQPPNFTDISKTLSRVPIYLAIGVAVVGGALIFYYMPRRAPPPPAPAPPRPVGS